MYLLLFFQMQNIKPGSTVPTTAKRQLHHRLYFHFTCIPKMSSPPIRSHLLHHHSSMLSSKKIFSTVPSLFQLPCHYLFYFIMHTSHEVCDGKILLYIPYQGFTHQDITDHPTSTTPLQKKGLNQHKIIQNFEMAEQRNHLGEYNTALAKVTRIIREQVRLIENNPSACIEYQRRINQERWRFAEAWNVIIRIAVRNFQDGYQSSTPNAGTTGRQAQRQITLLPFEAPALWRSCSDTFREFIFSLPHISRHSLGAEKECNICYYPFFASRGKLEADAIRKGTVPRPDKSLEPHEVSFSDLPELPVRLPCGHVFGQICVLKWVSGGGSENPPKCPICRAIWTPVGWSNRPPGQVTIEV